MRTKSVSCEIVYTLINYASDRGIDLQDVYRIVKLNPDLLKDTSARIPVITYQELWNEIEYRAMDKDFGLHFGEATKDSFRGNILCSVMMNCPDTGEAINRFIKYYKLLSDLITPKLEAKGEYAYFTWDIGVTGINIGRNQSESFLMMQQSILKCVGCKNIAEVRFFHPQPENISDHKRLFTDRVLFNQNRNEIVLESEDLHLPIQLCNEELLTAHERVAASMLEKLHSKDQWADKVLKLLSKNFLNQISPVIDSVAKELAVSTRNLQIHLKDEGYSYQSLLDKVREEMALSYLKEPNFTFYDIAYMLGFSEQSSFNRAFKRWTGTNPNDYRKNYNRYSSIS